MADKAEAFHSVTQSACAVSIVRLKAPSESRMVRQAQGMKVFIFKRFEELCHNFHK
jgi:hypothetical protein